MTVSADLAWWRARDGTAGADPAALQDLLARLRVWQAAHDEDRARQPGPFLKMAWDAVFGDEHAAVAEAVAQIEAALAGPGGGGT